MTSTSPSSSQPSDPSSQLSDPSSQPSDPSPSPSDPSPSPSDPSPPADPATSPATPYLPPLPTTPSRSAATAWTPPEPSRASRDLAAFWAAAHPGASPAVLGAAVGVGLAGAVLLVGQRPGLGWALVAVAAWGAAAPGLVRRGHAGDLLLAGWSALLLVVVAVRDASWVVALSTVVGLGTAAVALTGGRTAPGVLLAPLGAVAAGARALPWTGRGLRSLARDGGRNTWVAVRSGVIALLLVVVFGALFAAADPVFASYVPRLRLDDLPARVVVGLLVAVVAAAAIQLARTPTPWADAAGPAPKPARPAEWLVPVVALDLVVLAFVGTWLVAVVRGDDYVKAATGLSYAQYARQGFGQLVAATALTLVVVAVAARRAPLATRADRLRARVALGALCVGTLGVVASALARMSLYVGTYGLSRLRLLSTWGEVAMGVIVVLVIVAGVRWRGAWLPRAAVHVVAVAMLSLALVNPDALVVRYNAAASDLPDGLDILYTSQLSADAVPAIDALDEPERSAILSRLGPVGDDGFAGWNLGRARAADLLAARADMTP